MNFNLDSIVKLGVDLQTGIDYTGGQDKYVSALQRFYKSSENNKVRIMDFLDTGDMESFAITVHALKSNARMIGASSLSEKFEVLELAARRGDSDEVTSNIKPAMEEYVALLEALKPLGEMESYKAAGEISGREALETVEKLLAALDDFDDDLSAELVEKLSGYPFRITQRNKLREAAELIGEFMYDEAADIIREIYPSIE